MHLFSGAYSRNAAPLTIESHNSQDLDLAYMRTSSNFFLVDEKKKFFYFDENTEESRGKKLLVNSSTKSEVAVGSLFLRLETLRAEN